MTLARCLSGLLGVCLSIALVGASPQPLAAATDAERPNIVVLMVDDLAHMDHRLINRLPHLKQAFLDGGVEFTDALGNFPLCCPARSSFLTGQTADHTGVIGNKPGKLDPSETIATELQAQGYWTALVGKYLNGYGTLSDLTPPGWDKFYVASGYYSSSYYKQGVHYHASQPQYVPDADTQQALKWLRRYAPPTKPVFLMLTPSSPHDDTGAKPEPAARHVNDPACAGIAPWKPPSYNEADVSDKPAYVRALGPVRPYGEDGAAGWPLQDVCEAMLAVDDMFRDVKAEMDAQGRTNTLYIFTVDNGMAWGAHRWKNKRTPYAVPMDLYFDWPGHLAPRAEDTTVSIIDLAPTLCAMAGCTMGPYPNGLPVDGMSFLPVLTGDAETLDRDAVPTQGDTAGSSQEMSWHGVRTTNASRIGRWEYTEHEDGECELYDLEADPWELTNHCNDRAYAQQQRWVEAPLESYQH